MTKIKEKIRFRSMQRILKLHKPAAFFSPPFQRVCRLSCTNPQLSCNLRTLIPELTRCSTMFYWPATKNKICTLGENIHLIYLPPANKLWEGNVFSRVCPSYCPPGRGAPITHNALDLTIHIGTLPLPGYGTSL